MKKNVLLMAMILMSSMIFAQTTVDRSAKAEKQAEQMKKELALNDAQFAKIKEINVKFRDGQARLVADTARTRENKMIERKRMQDERSAQIKGVLTKEQYAQWTALKENKKKSIQKRVKPGDKAKNEINELKTELSLTDEQYRKIMAVNDRIAGRIKKVRSDSTVSHDNMRVEMKKAKEEKNAAYKDILTKEQYGKYLAYEAEKKNHRKPDGRHEKEKIKKG
jgi:hypothetical protein